MSSNIEITKICVQCGCEFTARTTKTKCCSDNCAKRAYKERMRAAKIDSATAEVKAVRSRPMAELRSKDYLSITEVCTLVGVSRWTVWRSIQQGELKAVKLGRRVIIRRADIDTLFEPQYIKPQPKEEQITQWCSVQDMMQKYSMTRDMVYNHIKSNRIPKKQDGRYVQISQKHFDALFQQQTNIIK